MMDLLGPKVSEGDWIIPLEWLHPDDYPDSYAAFGGLNNKPLKVRRLDHGDGTILCESPAGSIASWWVKAWRISGYDSVQPVLNPAVQVGDLIEVIAWKFPDNEDRYLKQAALGLPIKVTRADSGFVQVEMPGGATCNFWGVERWRKASSGSTGHSVSRLPEIDSAYSGIADNGKRVSISVYKVTQMEFWDEISGEDSRGNAHSIRLERG